MSSSRSDTQKKAIHSSDDVIAFELELFERAKNWKRYWAKSIAKYVSGSAVEVGAGIGVNAAYLLNDNVKSLMLLEPGITLVSRCFYGCLHPEPVDMDADPLLDGPIDSRRHPFDANQGFATVLVTKKKKRLEKVVPGISIIEHRWIGSLAYPLSGGFQRWSLVPSGLVRPVLALESLLDSTLGRWCGFRLLITLERNLVEH